jgi:hypothetical protein
LAFVVVFRFAFNLQEYDLSVYNRWGQKLLQVAEMEVLMGNCRIPALLSGSAGSKKII